MEPHGLSKKGLERVFKFEGYGNKHRPYWFIGIEEGGGSIEQLRLRARLYDDDDDLGDGEGWAEVAGGTDRLLSREGGGAN